MDKLEGHLAEVEKYFEEYEKKEITLDHLKKIVRSELLFMWSDATDEGKHSSSR